MYSPTHSGRPCWPVIWLWLLSVTHYCYRYILQVNDPRTSPIYSATPPLLSAIKYAILVLFAGYALFRLWRRPISISPTYRRLLSITAWALLILAAVFLARLAAVPGDLDETLSCAVQLIPWMASVFMIPLLFTPEHSLASTLATFERLMFWILFPFWLITVILVAAGLRYPALSYPGLIVRFGGIMDDPNGYACLCLLLLVLSAGVRDRGGKLRAVIYGVMLLCTLSLTGYFTATVACLVLVWSRLTKSGTLFRPTLARISWACGASLVLVALLIAIHTMDDTVTTALNTLYSAKSISAATHISNIAPDSAMLDVSFPMEVLVGIGGFSENFYWRILVNFGWLGFFAAITPLLAWAYYGLPAAKRWSNPLRSWYIAALAGAVGLAYPLVFPLSLIFWSLLAILVRATDFLKAPREA